MHPTKTGFIVLFCCSITVAVAQPQAFVCEFTSRHTGTLEPYQAIRAGERLSLTFASIDISGGAAQMIGNAGATPVAVLANEGRMHFMEVTRAGNLSTTSVFTFTPSAETLSAVHSRHMMVGKSAVISQYTGTCTPKF